MRKLLVTGTDTDVGKTWTSCLILRLLLRGGIVAGAYKPVCSGVQLDVNGNKFWYDVEQLAGAIGWTGDRDQICPQRFDAAVAPNVAAAQQGDLVDEERLVSGIHAWDNSASHVVIEGAGGLLCPLSDSVRVADLAARWDCPLVIVAANRLGVINHTLLTVETALNRGLSIAAVVLNQCDHTEPTSDESRTSNLVHLKHWLPDVNVFECPYNAEHFDAAGQTRPAVADWFR